MILNLATLRSELGNKLKNTTIANSRKDRWLNLAVDDIATEFDPEYLHTTIEFQSIADQRKYFLKFKFNCVLSLQDLDNDIDLMELTESRAESWDPDRSDTGTPDYFMQTGMSYAKGEPTSASVVTIVSTSTADTTQKVRINGVVNGVQDTELLTLNGTTDVVGSKSFTSISEVIKDVTTAGVVTATTNSGAVTVAQIPSFLLAEAYQPINLFPVPSSAINYRARGIRVPKMMVNDQDIPDIPSIYHELVLFVAAMRGHMDLFRPTLAAQVKALEVEPMLNKLRKDIGNKRRKRSPVLRGQLYDFFFPNNFPSSYEAY